MTILSADMRFFAAQYPTDDAYGGGPMSANIVQDGVSANVFPLIGPSDANIGRVLLRKCYAAVLSANTDLLINAANGTASPAACVLRCMRKGTSGIPEKSGCASTTTPMNTVEKPETSSPASTVTVFFGTSCSDCPNVES